MRRIAAINTIRSVLGVDLDTLRRNRRSKLHHARRLFVPSRDADRIADVHGDCQSYSERISGQKRSAASVGIETGNDAAQFILSGATRCRCARES